MSDQAPRRDSSLLFIFAIFCATLAIFAFCRTVSAQGLTPEQQEAIAQALNLPPGTTIQFEQSKTTDNGTLQIDEEATGQGASLRASGDKIVNEFNASAPGANLGKDRTATGGTTDATNKITASASNPLVWAGILCWLGAGVCVYLRLPIKTTLIPMGAGLAFFSAAFFPQLLLLTVIVAAAILVGPYVYKEWQVKQVADAKAKADEQARKNNQTLRAVVAGVSDFGKVAADPNIPVIPPEAYEKLKSEIASHMAAVPGAEDLVRHIKSQERR